MYAKNKGLQVPSDIQARDKYAPTQLVDRLNVDVSLAFNHKQHLQHNNNNKQQRLIVYVYEYLMQLGAKNTAHSFLSEVGSRHHQNHYFRQRSKQYLTYSLVYRSNGTRECRKVTRRAFSSRGGGGCCCYYCLTFSCCNII